MSADVVNGRDRRAPAAPLAVGVVNVAFVTGALAVLMSLAGAFDTDTLGFPHRLSLWLVLGGLLIGQGALLDHVFAWVAPFRLAARLIAACAAFAATTILMTVELYVLKLTPLTPVQWGEDPLLQLVPNVAPLTAVIMASIFVLRLRREGWLRWPARAGRTAPRLLAGPVIAGLLPPPVPAADLSNWPAGRVLSVQAQDHYLEVVTDRGSAFLRGRMKDAVARLARVEGMQVHRSWWVARDAVAGLRRGGRDAVLVLTDGREVPVGRGRLRTLRARGWLTVAVS